MRMPLRQLAISSLLLALVVPFSPGAASAAPADVGHDRIAAQQMLHRVQTLLAPGPAAARRAGQTLPNRDLTLAMRDLIQARSALGPKDRALADSLLARPSASGDEPQSSSETCEGQPGENVLESEHFCLHYGDDVSEGWAATTRDTLEHVWTAEVGGLGYKAPLADGDGLFDVTLLDIGDDGLYGYCAPDTDEFHSTAYCVLDDDFSSDQFDAEPIDSLQVTAAHEFFHAIQFNYDAGEDNWFMEGTAVWMEDQLYPDINDYYQYLSDSAIAQPRHSIDDQGDMDDDVYVYGSVLFWKYLSEHFHNPVVIRQVWNYAYAGDTVDRDSLQAVRATLAYRGTSFGSAFAQFGAWNTLQGASYADRMSYLQYERPAWWGRATLRPSRRDAGNRTVTLNHLTNAALYVGQAGRLTSRSRLSISVDAPNRSTGSAATVQLLRRDGQPSLSQIVLNASGNATRVVSFNPSVVRGAVVTLTNAGGSNGRVYRVRVQLR